MSDPRKHHYIPQFYLRQWTGKDGQLVEFRRRYRGVEPRLRSPKSTGYELDLYRLKGVPEPLANAIETGFMSMVDRHAADIMKAIIEGAPAPQGSDLRSPWVRFLLSLIFRNPETVKMLFPHLIAIWETGVSNLRASYASVRRPEDPEAFDEFIARTDPHAREKRVIHFFRSLMNMQEVGDTIVRMKWYRVGLERSNTPLLTSDRPLDMPGIGMADGYFTLPVSPSVMFLAGHDDRWRDRMASANHTTVARNINRATVRRARRYVWASDRSQLALVVKHISADPDRVLITEEQKQMALDAAAGGPAPDRC